MTEVSAGQRPTGQSDGQSGPGSSLRGTLKYDRAVSLRKHEKVKSVCSQFVSRGIKICLHVFESVREGFYIKILRQYKDSDRYRKLRKIISAWKREKKQVKNNSLTESNLQFVKNLI